MFTEKFGYLGYSGRVLSHPNQYSNFQRDSIFEFRKRNIENINQVNVVLVIPTGVGAEIGGHAGDGGPVAKIVLLGEPKICNPLQ